MLYLAVVGVELVALGMHFDNCGSICAPVPGLAFPLVIMLNWDRKAWTSFWYLMERRPSLKSLVRVRFLFLSPLLGGLVLPLLIYEVLVRYP